MTRKVSDLRKTNGELLSALCNIVMNAEIIPDPGMKGATDIYVVPLDDIRAAQGAIARATEK